MASHSMATVARSAAALSPAPAPRPLGAVLDAAAPTPSRALPGAPDGLTPLGGTSSAKAGRQLLVVVITGGSTPCAGTAELKCHATTPDGWQSPRAVTPLMPEEKVQALGGTDFPADAIVYDVSCLRGSSPATDSWEVKLHPAPPEPYQFIGYLVDSEWNSSRAHSTNHLAVGTLSGSFRRQICFESSGLSWRFPEQATPPHRPRLSPHERGAATLTPAPKRAKSSPSSQKKLRFDRKDLLAIDLPPPLEVFVFDDPVAPKETESVRPAPLLAKVVRPPDSAARNPTELFAARPVPSIYSQAIQQRLSQFAPIEPRKTTRAEVYRAFAKLQNKKHTLKHAEKLPRAAPACTAPTAPPKLLAASKRRFEDEARLERLASSTSSTASTCSLQSECSGIELLDAIEGLTSGSMEDDMLDAHLDELLQYVE